MYSRAHTHRHQNRMSLFVEFIHRNRKLMLMFYAKHNTFIENVKQMKTWTFRTRSGWKMHQHGMQRLVKFRWYLPRLCAVKYFLVGNFYALDVKLVNKPPKLFHNSSNYFPWRINSMRMQHENFVETHQSGLKGENWYGQQQIHLTWINLKSFHWKMGTLVASECIHMLCNFSDATQLCP